MSYYTEFVPLKLYNNMLKLDKNKNNMLDQLKHIILQTFGIIGNFFATMVII
jgi:hypothetical protein